MGVHMITEYKRDMYHNFVVIHDESSCFSDYYEQVLTHNQIFGHLKFECRMFDNKKYAYYEISGLQPLSSVFEKHSVLYTELKQIFNGLIEGIHSGKEYLLKENDYMLSSTMIFFNISKFEVRLCYYPGYDKTLRVQFHDLFEYFMNKVNYNDQAAVLLIYKLYMKSKDDTCTIQELQDILNGDITVDAVDSRDIEKENDVTGNNKNEIHLKDGVLNKNEIIHPNKESLNKPTKDGKGNHSTKSMGIKELSKDTEAPINKIYNRLPFVSERVEEEKEKLYYPASCYVMCLASIVFSLVIYFVAYKKKYIFQELRPRIDPTKNIALILVLGVIVLYVFTKVFGKKHRIGKMVPEINYLEPTLSNIDSPNRVRVQQNEQGVSSFHSQLGENKWKQEQVEENEVGEEERTIMLSNFINVKQVRLLPVLDDTYEMIRIEAFPFFVGKLKTHIDVHIPSPAISRFHAKIIKEENEYYVVDLNSTNGTFVNGEMVESYQKKKIEHGYKISFANIDYIFNCM